MALRVLLGFYAKERQILLPLSRAPTSLSAGLGPTLASQYLPGTAAGTQGPAKSQARNRPPSTTWLDQDLRAGPKTASAAVSARPCFQPPPSNPRFGSRIPSQNRCVRCQLRAATCELRASPAPTGPFPPARTRPRAPPLGPAYELRAGPAPTGPVPPSRTRPRPRLWARPASSGLAPPPQAPSRRQDTPPGPASGPGLGASTAPPPEGSTSCSLYIGPEEEGGY
ncbi:vegetative cell wall protein gp1-like [Molossus molossus]|uniref:vegetative cell wall protein gp1-like n=1 Tax=Molossus molossus TaxID=27622 RepID=UPI0017473BB1|nr:vegetative cell wall protein gp1-like [Molossus molossus]